MNGLVFVVSTDRVQSQEICEFLEKDNYRTVALDSLQDLKKKIVEKKARILILDLDTLPVTNRIITDLKREIPGLLIIGFSCSPFHPDLKEALSNHISVCLGKPPDLDELLYCVRSFFVNEQSAD